MNEHTNTQTRLNNCFFCTVRKIKVMIIFTLSPAYMMRILQPRCGANLSKTRHVSRCQRHHFYFVTEQSIIQVGAAYRRKFQIHSTKNSKLFVLYRFDTGRKFQVWILYVVTAWLCLFFDDLRTEATEFFILQDMSKRNFCMWRNAALVTPFTKIRRCS